MIYNAEEIQTLIITKLRGGGLTDKERVYLDKAITEDKDMKLLYDHIHEVLESPEALNAMDDLDNRVKVENLMVDSPRHRNWGNTRIGLGIAAMVLVIFGIYTTIHTSKGGSNHFAVITTAGTQLVLSNGQVINLDKQDSAIQAGKIALNNSNHTLTYTGTAENVSIATVNVPAGKYYNIVLSDGTKVMLNSATKLEFPFNFSGNSREIRIDGEAYLDVKQIANKPFIVHLHKSIVQVLGTSFNINTYDDKENVSLINGKVKILTNKDSIVLNPGQETSVTENELITAEFDETEVLAWKKGMYIYHNSTMEEIAKVLTRMYSVNIQVDESLSGKHFYGIADRSKPIEKFLEQLHSTNEIDYIIKDGIIYIKPF